MKTVLICHHDDALNSQAIPRWLSSFSDVVLGIVSIHEESKQKRARLERELKRLGHLRFLDVLAYRFFHRIFVQPRDEVYERQLLARLMSTLSAASGGPPGADDGDAQFTSDTRVPRGAGA